MQATLLARRLVEEEHTRLGDVADGSRGEVVEQAAGLDEALGMLHFNQVTVLALESLVF